MAITTGLASPVRHPIAGNLFTDPDAASTSMGGDPTTPATGGGAFTLTRASTATYVAQDGYLDTAGVDVARFDYDPMDATTMSGGGWLFEDAKTNLMARSESLDHVSWVATGCTITADSLVAPDGATTMDVIVEDGTTGAHGVARTSGTFVAGSRACLSCFALPINRNWLHLAADLAGGTSEAWFNISTGTVGTTSGAAAEYAYIEGPYRDGRYRCALQLDTAGGDTTVPARVEAADADASTSYTGTSQDSIAAWGIQVEVDEMTSYIPAPTTTVARSQDLGAIDLQFGSSNRFDLYLDFAWLAAVGADAQLLVPCGTDSGANGEAFSYFKNALGKITFNISDDSAALRFLTLATVTGLYKSRYVSHIRWENERLNLDGEAYMTDDGAEMPFDSNSQPGTAMWTDMPTEFRFYDVTRSTAIKVYGMEFGT
jgi:hypothetical protein